MGLSFRMYYKNEFIVKQVKDFVYETIHKKYDPTRLIIHKDGNKMNNHIDNLEYEGELAEKKYSIFI